LRTQLELKAEKAGKREREREKGGAREKQLHGKEVHSLALISSLVAKETHLWVLNLKIKASVVFSSAL